MSANPYKLNPLDLFPLIEESQYNYSDAKLHAEAVDRYLGFQLVDTELLILANEKFNPKNSPHPFTPEYWRGLPLDVLQTPYIEIRLILKNLNAESLSKIVDLGAGYGRMAHVIAAHYPNLQFLGLEYLSPRVTEGHRILKKQNYSNSSNLVLKEQDLSHPDFQLPTADAYFIYDFGSRPAIEKTIEALKIVARAHPIKVVGRGRSTRQVIEKDHPWLSQVHSPQHYQNYTIYQS